MEVNYWTNSHTKLQTKIHDPGISFGQTVAELISSTKKINGIKKYLEKKIGWLAIQLS